MRIFCRKERLHGNNTGSIRLTLSLRLQCVARAGSGGHDEDGMVEKVPGVK